MASTLTRTLIDPVREKVMAGERLDFDDGVALLESDDLLDGTVTLPLLLAAQRDEHVAAALLDRERAAADVVGVLARVAATGAVADTRRAVLEHAEAARTTLNALPDRSDRRALEAIVQAATTRDH